MAATMSVKDLLLHEGHGVKGISDMGLSSLPEPFIQPPGERLDISDYVSAEESIPSIDLSNWDHDPKVADSICDAAEKWGFFRIVNHGVPLAVLDDVKEAAAEFFGLSTEEKKKYRKENSVSKNVSLTSSFSPQSEKYLEWRDYLSCFYVSDEEANAFWPPTCRKQMLEYMKRSESIIRKIFEALMKRLNITEIDETLQSVLMGLKVIHLNYYPICPNPELTIGAGRHTDASTLTTLLQDEIGGLFVRKRETCNWIHVPPVRGSLIINVGDALQIMSNGRYKSVEHRVAANGNKNRVSVPIFVGPKRTTVIGPLPQVLEGGAKATYRNVLYSDYLDHVFQKPHCGAQSIKFVEI